MLHLETLKYKHITHHKQPKLLNNQDNYLQDV